MKPPRIGVNRRDLLRLRRPLDEGASDSQPGATTGSLFDLVRVHRPAMGSSFEIRLPAGTPGAVDLSCRALDLIDAIEAQMTVYRDDSEVSRLNATAHLGPVAVEPGLFRLLQEAVDLSRETGGAYDVTSGALSEAWGFVKGPRRVPEPLALAEARSRTGWQHLRLDPERRTVAFDREGIRINLGSIGKGYAIDRAVELLRAYWWPTSGLVHGGRSSLFALGSPPGRFGARWEVTLYNPFQPESPLGVFGLRNRAIGTSGTAFQQFIVDGRVFGHIIDPRSGEPALGPASVTVLAPTAAAADVLSTAFYLLGADAASAYIDAHPEIGAVFVESSPTAENDDPSPRIRVLGLSEYDFVAEAATLR
ncbi:MAG: FAD:protein FMN transferase [Isosphaeraceae bacterium]